MTKKIRFSTLLRDFGPVQKATAISDEAWQQARAEGRYMTVYHGENDWGTPVLGVIRHDGCVNTLCKAVFAKPLPPEVTEVIGMRNNDDARDILT